VAVMRARAGVSRLAAKTIEKTLTSGGKAWDVSHGLPVYNIGHTRCERCARVTQVRVRRVCMG
jgi:hypothetical protein